jgi:hypothetical protein
LHGQKPFYEKALTFINFEAGTYPWLNTKDFIFKKDHSIKKATA